MSLTQAEEELEEEASPIVVYAVYSEMVMMAQNLRGASTVSNLTRVDVGRQKPLPVSRHQSPHRPKTTVPETSMGERWNELVAWTQDPIVNK